ncbi:hypothetical protein MPDQ_000087 [Monascus purpureus]|uniref:Uncharacterized protein n=1 Tax=Monascus purpureus TaxID=5098 RepID=A0A507R730_MONPU|nr:hypothetical protein MPDQ_000087 [Monascus purpureus]BDD56655.1 hypothetical protein MAP00_002084 [Monascus purpureus]
MPLHLTEILYPRRRQQRRRHRQDEVYVSFPPSHAEGSTPTKATASPSQSQEIYETDAASQYSTSAPANASQDRRRSLSQGIASTVPGLRRTDSSRRRRDDKPQNSPRRHEDINTDRDSHLDSHPNPPTGYDIHQETNQRPSRSEEEENQDQIMHVQAPEYTNNTDDKEPTLPTYNDISGSVVVDHDGTIRFLSPQEVEERRETLQRAVHERMMGLPRLTESPWSPVQVPVQDDIPLPRYEP